MKRITVLAIAAALLLLAHPAPMSAQLWSAGPPGEDIGSISVLLGSVMPQSSLPDGASFGSGTAIGGSATWWPFRYLGFRANMTRAETPGQEGHQFSSVAFEEPVVWLYNADVALRYPVSFGGRLALTPYVAGGYGGKSYDWSLNRVSAGTAGNTSFGWTIAGGTDLRPSPTSPIGLKIEVLNQRSEFKFFEYAGPHSAHEFYRDEVVVHDEGTPGVLSYPTIDDLIFTVGLTLYR